MIRKPEIKLAPLNQGSSAILLYHAGAFSSAARSRQCTRSHTEPIRSMQRSRCSSVSTLYHFSGSTRDTYICRCSMSSLQMSPKSPRPGSSRLGRKQLEKIADLDGLHRLNEDRPLELLNMRDRGLDELDGPIDLDEKAPHFGPGRPDFAGLIDHPFPNRQNRSRRPGEIAEANADEARLGLAVQRAEHALHYGRGESVGVADRGRGLVGGHPDERRNAFVHAHPGDILGARTLTSIHSNGWRSDTSTYLVAARG